MLRTRADLGDALAHFEEHGYARLEGVADEQTLGGLRARSDDLMLGRVTYPNLFFQLDTSSGSYDTLTYGRGFEGPSLNYRKIEKLEKDPLYRAWLENPLFESIARARIEGDIVIYRAIIMSKGAAEKEGTVGGTYLPWHQDGGKFWGLDRDPMLQVWTALDDAPIEAGCIEVFPGSHRAGLVTPLGGVVPAKFVDAAGANDKGVFVPARAGDVLLIHNHLWHRSGVNATPRLRRAFSVCYMTAATRCLRTKKAPRVFTPVFRGERVESKPGG